MGINDGGGSIGEDGIEVETEVVEVKFWEVVVIV